jgi:Holliday junction resolvase RusA-like endonuclease
MIPHFASSVLILTALNSSASALSHGGIRHCSVPMVASNRYTTPQRSPSELYAIPSDPQTLHSAQKRTRKRLASKDLGRQFWTDESDQFIFITEKEGDSSDATNSTRRRAKFTIRGKPLPLVRHRSRRGFMYNPSATAQEEFRDSLLQMMPKHHHPIIVDDGISGDAPITFFGESDFLEVSIVFRFKRPKSHFVNNTPGEGRIKPNAPGRFHATRTDIDNLAKFVLDSLNGLLYADDRQVVSLKLIKMLDSDGLCDGATDVTISVLQDETFDSSDDFNSE